eukprot:355910-Chlamydomonas_euryale.AAC.2
MVCLYRSACRSAYRSSTVCRTAPYSAAALPLCPKSMNPVFLSCHHNLSCRFVTSKEACERQRRAKQVCALLPGRVSMRVSMRPSSRCDARRA